jgi:hypothetical protein
MGEFGWVLFGDRDLGFVKEVYFCKERLPSGRGGYTERILHNTLIWVC